MVCHACYDAPCQLKTTSWEGLARGASKTPVYDATRLRAATPSRLGVDADKPSEWRARDFSPVLNEHRPTPEAHRGAGLMHRLLMLKQQHPLPAGDVVEGGLDFSLERSATCPAEAEIDRYERATPQGGMPFGLPGLSASEHRVLTRWLEQGAPYEGPAAPTPLATQRVAQWERFFNGDSLKERLFSRYAYEHLFLAHLHFDDDPERQYFRLVRSATPPGQPPRLIASPRPVDDPGVSRVYYRLVPERETIVAKTHMPYALGPQRMARWRALFLDTPDKVDRLPGYSAETAANPFATFADLPVAARYRFMLDEAEFTIMGFIKGPVCRGQMALNVIDDHFWVVFLAPSSASDAAQSALLAKDVNLMRLPTGSSSTPVLIPWLQYARAGERLSEGQVGRPPSVAAGLARLDLRLIWDGEGRNDNAALTVFRHFDSASVVKGMVGEAPKTAWVIGYPLLERIHYLLVANYDVYGNVGHQLNSRLYMDFLRMEGEFNFLTLLPQPARLATRDHWYRGDSLATREQVYGGATTTLAVDSAIRYSTTDPKRELLDMLRAKLAPVLSRRFDIDRRVAPPLRAPLQELARVRGASLQWLPESALPGGRDAGRGRHPQPAAQYRPCQRLGPARRAPGAPPRRGHADRRTRGARKLPQCLLPRARRRAAGPDRGDSPAALGSRLRILREALGGAPHQPGLLGVQRRTGGPLSKGAVARSWRPRLQPLREPIAQHGRGLELRPVRLPSAAGLTAAGTRTPQ